MRDPVPEFISAFKSIHDVLLRFGWILPSFMTRMEMDIISEFCLTIKDADPEDKQIHIKLNHLIEDLVFHPNFRAFYVFRSMQIPHLIEYSHFIERAVFNYYKRDFISCAFGLIPVVEGVLLQHYGWEFDQETLNTKTLTQKLLQSSVRSTLKERHQLFAETLVEFLDKWFFKKTKELNFEVSSLNRHYATHLLGTRNFYSSHNCHKLFLFFDLYTELLSLEYDVETYCFIPIENEALRKRRDYYHELLVGELNSYNIYTIENAFLQEHKNFQIDEDPPSIERSYEKSIERELELKKLIGEIKQANK